MFLVFSASMTHLYLRNRKHVPRFYQVIETRVKVWENEKCSGGKCFYSYLEFSQTFTSVSLTQLATQRTCFLFLLENTATQKRKIDLFTLIIKMSILFACTIITSTAHASSMILSSYRNTVLNQSAPIFALGYFLIFFFNYTQSITFDATNSFCNWAMDVVHVKPL